MTRSSDARRIDSAEVAGAAERSGAHISRVGEYAWKMSSDGGLRSAYIHIGADVCVVTSNCGVAEHYRGEDALMFALAAAYKAVAV